MLHKTAHLPASVPQTEFVPATRIRTLKKSSVGRRPLYQLLVIFKELLVQPVPFQHLNLPFLETIKSNDLKVLRFNIESKFVELVMMIGTKAKHVLNRIWTIMGPA